jgi:predicted nuclease with TOPRIM domain
LRQEVTGLRKSLEDIRGKHDQEIAELQGQVEESETGKEHAETQYRDLLGRVNGIKAQLGERLKADAVCPVLPPSVLNSCLTNV